MNWRNPKWHLRRLAVLSALGTIACAPREDTTICTPLASQQVLDAADREKPRTSEGTGRLAADCVIVNARRFSVSNDPSLVVAAVVTSKCRDQIDRMHFALLTALANDPQYVDPPIPTDFKGEIDAAAKKAALLYVVEARSGHCSVRRGSATKTPPSLFDWMN